MFLCLGVAPWSISSIVGVMFEFGSADRVKVRIDFCKGKGPYTDRETTQQMCRCMCHRVTLKTLWRSGISAEQTGVKDDIEVRE